jgi:hypothetical protein
LYFVSSAIRSINSFLVVVSMLGNPTFLLKCLSLKSVRAASTPRSSPLPRLARRHGIRSSTVTRAYSHERSTPLHRDLDEPPLRFLPLPGQPRHEQHAQTPSNSTVQYGGRLVKRQGFFLPPCLHSWTLGGRLGELGGIFPSFWRGRGVSSPPLPETNGLESPS